MTRSMARLSRWAALATAGGFLLLDGAGSCLPENFYSTLLGDTIIAGTVSAVLNGFLAQAGL